MPMQVVYYADEDESEPVAAYWEAVARAGESRVIATFEHRVGLLGVYGLGVLSLGSRFARVIDRRGPLYELRVGDHRVAFAEHAGTIVLLHAWRKRTQKLDERAAGRARTRLADWAGRHPAPSGRGGL
jgi:S-adenosylmethionine:diacylglycerol 3-amino-3-carboxypropyl transferase